MPTSPSDWLRTNTLLSAHGSATLNAEQVRYYSHGVAVVALGSK
jgi:hypothetical protein